MDGTETLMMILTTKIRRMGTMINFQKGEYPVKQVIYVELDSVLGGLITSNLLKPKYGTIDIIHSLRTSESESDVDLLMKTTMPVVSTCWSFKRLSSCLKAYADRRGWKKDDIRVYELGRRLSVSK